MLNTLTSKERVQTTYKLFVDLITGLIERDERRIFLNVRERPHDLGVLESGVGIKTAGGVVPKGERSVRNLPLVPDGYGKLSTRPGSTLGW